MLLAMSAQFSGSATGLKPDRKDPNAMWDYWSLSPESLHQVTILFSDRGIPKNNRHMNGYGRSIAEGLGIKIDPSMMPLLQTAVGV